LNRTLDRKQERRMADAIGYTLFETGFGACGLAWSERGIVRLVLPEASPPETETRLRRQAGTGDRKKPPPAVAMVTDLVRAYFDGGAIDFSRVALDLSAAAAFEQQVYAALREVAWGATTTYGELASAAGSPGAARAVGRAMAHNPVPVIVPCHRVLAAGGTIGGFSAHGGVSTKQRMLALERVMLAV
jgi:methylated-DNA-[protein]-cysteine S-methyltransferase